MSRVLFAVIFLLFGSAYSLSLATSLRKAAVTSLATLTLGMNAANAITLSGVVLIPDGVPAPTGSDRALYVTVKPDIGVINAQILNIKVPPIMTKRIPASLLSFPYTYTIDEVKDATEEAAASKSRWEKGDVPLIVSVRYDNDGVAATRSPEDLVGKGESSFISGDEWSKADVQLSDRGIGGKLVTGKIF